MSAMIVRKCCGRPENYWIQSMLTPKRAGAAYPRLLNDMGNNISNVISISPTILSGPPAIPGLIGYRLLR